MNNTLIERIKKSDYFDIYRVVSNVPLKLLEVKNKLIEYGNEVNHQWILPIKFGKLCRNYYYDMKVLKFY
jgi:hypothetical protein